MNRKKFITFDEALKPNRPTAFSAMIKPAGSVCNLGCRYCYYLDKASLYENRQSIMDDELLETTIKQYIQANDIPQIMFVWHGGEPLIAGLDFYKKAVDLQRQYANGKQIENVLQTNGMLIDEAWCRFFAEHRFLIGISIDGPASVHDAYRRNKAGEATFDKVMNAIELMKKYNISLTQDDLQSPKIFHSITGAHFAREHFPEFTDREIFLSILYHTTGKPSMTLFQKLIYLADYIEPLRDFPDCIRLRDFFYSVPNINVSHLDKTLLLSFDLTISNLVEEKQFIHKKTVAARNYLLLK